MKLLKVLTAFIALVSLQIAAAQWLHVPPPVEARSLMMVGGGVPVAADGCATAKDGDNTSATYTSSNQFLGREDVILYLGDSFVAGSSYTVCAVEIQAYKVNSPTFLIKAAIFTDSSGSPGSLIGTASGTLDTSTITATTTGEKYTLTGLSADVTSGTTYWVVLYYVSGPHNYYVDYIDVLANAQGGGGHWVKRADATPTWANLTEYISLKFKTYGP